MEKSAFWGGRNRFFIIYCVAGLILFLTFVGKEKEVYNKPDGTNGDRSIGHIKNGVEKHIGSSPDEGYPFRPSELEEGEIEHVYNLALHERSVASSGGEEMRYLVGAFVEDDPVETTVDKVAYGTCQNKRKVAHHRCGCTFLDKFEHIPHQGTRSNKAEDREEYLAESFAQRDAESKAVILSKVQQAPIANQRNLLANMHVGFYHYFDYLVYYQNAAQQNAE